MGQLEKKVAVITGSTRGLGLALAQVYAREGAAVVVSSRSSEAVTRAVESIHQAGGRAAGMAVDIRELAQVKNLATFALAQFGKLDIWVNNAGIPDVFGPTTAVDPDRYTEVLQTNIFGTYYGSLVALTIFLEQQTPAKLINILGRGDRGFAPYQSAYGSSKSWIRSFTLTLAREYRQIPGLGIYAFNPGLMDTDLLRKVDVVQGYEHRLKHFGVIIRMWGKQPSVPAEKALWLASTATDGKTGLEVSMLGARTIVGGLLREQARKLLHRPASTGEIAMTTRQPYTMKEILRHQ